MSKIDDARDILRQMHYPRDHPSEMAALTLLALAGIKPGSNWSDATQRKLGVSKGIMPFMRGEYGKHYEPNTREDVRKTGLKLMMHVGIVDRNPGWSDLPTNSPNTFYALSGTAVEAIRRFGTGAWDERLRRHLAQQGVSEKIRARRQLRAGVPIELPDGGEVNLPAGKHNDLIAAIVEELVAHFFSNASVMYLGDAAKRDRYLDETRLAEFGLELSTQTQLPDVILAVPEPKCLVMVEAVVSGGEITDARLTELQELSRNCPCGRLYVSAFADFARFRKCSERIAWETEVWIAERADHLIHFDGEHFLKPT